MLLLMWKILLMNFYLSTTSELLPMSGLTAAPDTNQSGTDTQTQAYTCIPTDRHTDRLLQCSSSSFLWVVTSTPLPKQATVHHMRMEDTIWNKTRTSQNKYHKHVSNPTQFSPAQPRPVLTLWLLWPNYWNLLLLLTTSLSLLTWVRFNFPFVICIINVLWSYILNNSPYYHPQFNSPCFNVPSFLSSHIDRLIGWQANSCHPYSSGS